ncbi:MAG: helix-hairpin-helix domain-containing protein [Sphingobacteriaceae bacterium]|nr:helix-hairpin-helix domain-containing protein [Sphingobacteriaceae bacterium]
MRFKVLFILLFYSFSSFAQKEETIRNLTENIANSLPEDFDMSELIEKLNFYQKNPINLNNTNAEELKNLVFLNPLQISNFFSHIETNGKLNDLLELQSIDGFDLSVIQNILPFVRINANNAYNNINLKNSLHEMLIRYGQTIEKQKGYTNLEERRYLGGPEKILFRYKYNYEKTISASLVSDKDAGENFLNNNKPSFISANVAFFELKKFKKIVIGDYALQFGQGLTLWSGFSFNKGADITSIAKKDIGLNPYSSANEYSFFRGIASTISIFKNIDFTPFISFRNLDSSLKLNLENETSLSNINQSGLHRTENEINNKNNLKQVVYGGVIQYQKANLSVGLVAYQTKFSEDFEQSTEPYKRYNFSGNKLLNIGLHYNYTYNNIYFFGEIARSSSNGLAYINGALISLSPILSTGILHRKYAENYHNFFNQSLAESSEANNESGFYAGLNINPSKHLSISFYSDYFRFPWLKYRVDEPSSGYDVFGQLNYMPSKTTKLTIRYKRLQKQQNTDLEKRIKFIENVENENYRVELNWTIKQLKLQNQLQVTKYLKGEAKAEFSHLIYQDISYVPKNSKISGNIRLAYFNSPSYNSRLYAYEDDVLYNFTFGMYNGKGIRSFLNLKYKLTKKIELWSRYAIFIYPNETTIGSDLDQINGNKKSEIRLQMRYQF